MPSTTNWPTLSDLNFHLEKFSASATATSERNQVKSHSTLGPPRLRRCGCKASNILWREMSLILLITALLTSSSWPCVQSKYHAYHEDSNSEEIFPSGRRIHASGNRTQVGLFPPVLNLATKAYIEVNATCGEQGPETYCKLVEHSSYRRSSGSGSLSRSTQCQVCDGHNSDKGKRHPIRYTIDGSNRWWQSPTLQNGRNFEWVTITIDLKQIYQVAYIIIKAAISPRPGNWILERSLDGYVYLPWQYYAISDDECWTRYRLRAKPGKPSFEDDEEVICSSYYSQITPFEGGEIHTSLVNGRPGADGPSEALTRFTMARYVRLRLQKIRTMHGDLMSLGGSGQASPFLDKSVLQRYFYSIKDISIGGHCVCFGHSNECVMDKHSQSEKCMCKGNTCGARCDMCCPLFNQYPWGAGNSTDSAACVSCQCFGHSESCVYDKLVHEQQLSINLNGEMDGGGVCLNCKSHTTGINCGECAETYYRPQGVLRDDPSPCVPCDCNSDGSEGGRCVSDEDEGRRVGGKNPGDCLCKPGYEGRRCGVCAVGFRGFPRCSECPCHIPGIVNTGCEGDCRCKSNVEGKHCSKCKRGFFNLIKENVEGCTSCFCHGVSSDCISSDFPIAQLRTEGHNWFVTDLHGAKSIPAAILSSTEASSHRGNETFTYQIANEEFASFSEYYWTPEEEEGRRVFGGNRIHSYGLNVTFHVSWVQARGDTSGRPIPDYDLIIKSTNSMLGFSFGVHDGENATISAVLTEWNCMVLPDVDNHVIHRYQVPPGGTPCTRYDVMEALSDIKRVLFRAKFHTDQIEGLLHYAHMEGAITDGSIARVGDMKATSVEVCQNCPKGYTGTSCQNCDYGWRKLNKDSWLTECVKCDCNGHSSSCDSEGNCFECENHTTGTHCQYCLEGYYAVPVKGDGSSSACKRCECPLAIPSNNFSPTCQSVKGGSYQCTQCEKGYEGDYCERCSNGYYGNPTQIADYCKPCDCIVGVEAEQGGKDICDHLTGECLVCGSNFVGWNCDTCTVGHYFNPLNGSCQPCDCSEVGSIAGGVSCHVDTGQCDCRFDLHVTGRRCDECQAGWWNLQSGKGCNRSCNCDAIGALGPTCDESGQCLCKSGVGGVNCDHCLEAHYGMSDVGCKLCDPCDKPGHICDPLTGRCQCPNNTDSSCQKCELGFWGDFRGCQPCDCSQHGARGRQCSPDAGKCTCHRNFDGLQCGKCAEGFYNYPRCEECGCDPAGTLESQCRGNGTCSCDTSGQCSCKKNVMGRRCDRCAPGTYALEESNPEGCMECFCFHKTNKCSQGYFKWQRFAMPISPSRVGSFLQSSDQLERVNSLMVIPDTAPDIIIEKDISFSVPLYWALPHIFLGDKVLSYNGFLRFHTHSIAGTPLFPHHVLSTYPVIQIQGNHRLILEHFPQQTYKLGYYEVQLHEDEWRLKNGPFNGAPSKEVMMVALQNLQHILVRATYSPEVYNASLFNVSLDIAIPSPTGDKSMAHGIEVCDCPPEYNSTSCQNPRFGYYRWYKRDYITSTVIIDLVGEARKCQCNGRAVSCDTETGSCQNCVENTAGPRCEICTEGYYGNPLFGRCLPCPCPTVWNNHAKSCYKLNTKPYLHHPQTQYYCQCQTGYTGGRCDRCDYGFYQQGGHCKKCNCNPYGSVAVECHQISGQCSCRLGVTGRDCSNCRDRHVIMHGKECTTCNDNCTGTLLNDLDRIGGLLSGLKVDPEQILVWKNMMNLDQQSKKAMVHVDWAKGVSLFVEDLPRHEGLSEMMNYRGKEMRTLCDKMMTNSYFVVEKGKLMLEGILAQDKETRRTAKFLLDYARGRVTPSVDLSWATEEAGNIINMLENTGLELSEVSMLAENELGEVNALYDVMIVKLFNSSGVARELLGEIRNVKGKLEELVGLLSQAEKNTDDANRVMITAKEFLDTSRLNVELIDNVTLGLDLWSILTETTLAEGGHMRTELEQVLFQIEDILREFRNTTKELEIRDNLLFDKVPLYRVLYAQPAFDHELELIMKRKYIESLFRSVRINDSKSIQGVTAYDRMREGFEMAFQVAANASQKAAQSGLRIQEILQENSGAQLLEASSELVNDGLALSGIIENGLQGNLSQCKKGIEGLTWNLKVANESLRHMNNKMDAFLENDMKLGELSQRIEEITDTISEANIMVTQTDAKVHSEIKGRIDAIKGGAPFDAVDAAIEVSRAEHQIPSLQGEIRKHERHQQRLSRKREEIEDKLKYLRALIKQSHHKANTLGVSLGPDETGTCFRIYDWPSMDSATSILFKFAPTRTEDSLLFYWPSSVNEDFIAVEMISLHIKASWNLGSGLRTLIHQTKLSSLSLNSDDPDHWYEISFERIGSAATLDVKPVSTDPTVPKSSIHSTPVKYINTDEEATLLTLSPGDYIHIGGMSREMRPGLVDNGLSGCIYDLRVNHQPLGLWNFARTEGCGPCVECPDIALETMPSGGNQEYYFDGRGYSVISRIQSQTFNSRFFDVGIEFKTFTENGLLFLTVNDTIGQIISLEMKEGKIIMQVRHRWEDQRDALRVQSQDKYNTGNWVVVRAVWVYQRGTQTAKLMIDKKDSTHEKRSTGSLSLKLYEATYQLGGISPTFDPSKWDDVLTIVPYVGCMKSILVDGSTYDAMSGHYFGVQSPCSGNSVFMTSFEGNGFAEFGSQSVGKNFKLGFSFKTMEPTGLMVLSTFAISVDSPDQHYYAVFLEGGRVHVQLGVPQGPFDLSSNNGTRYNDGRWHSTRFFKKGRKLYLYLDDEELVELRLPRQVTATVNAPHGRGLFIGGTTSNIQRKFEETPLQVRRGFLGCIQNFYFENLINFNYPVSYQNQNLGQCPPHHDPDPLLLLHSTKYLFPNTIDSGRHEVIVRMSDPECTPHEDPVIEQEEQFKAWHFGNTPNSYATLSLLSSKILKQNFNITFQFRTLYPNGMLFQGLKKRSKDGTYCLMSFLKDGQVIVKLHGTRPQDLVSSVSGLNDGKWHQITIVKAEDKLYLHIDGRNGTQTQVPKIKAIARMHIGGVPGDGQDCLENSIHKPVFFHGCMKNVIINSHFYNLDSNSAQLSNVEPCFRHVEPGSFFRTGSYAIYSHNFTLGAMLEVQLDFRSDSRSGLLLKLVPNKSSKYPQFSIFLKDGKVIARETLSIDEHYEAVADFQLEMKGYVCDGHWHTIRCNYEKGSITLRVDNRQPIYAVAEPDTIRIGGGGGGNNASGGIFPGSSDVSTIFIGGTDDGASRSNNKLQFHGCIRNIVLNRQIRDWTDMALIHNVFVNSCPL